MVAYFLMKFQLPGCFEQPKYFSFLQLSQWPHAKLYKCRCNTYNRDPCKQSSSIKDAASLLIDFIAQMPTRTSSLALSLIFPRPFFPFVPSFSFFYCELVFSRACRLFCVKRWLHIRRKKEVATGSWI